MDEPTTTERDLIEKLADSFIASYRAGHRPSVERYVEQYPELADQLRDIITALIVLEQNAPHRSRLDVAARQITQGAPRVIGEFTILREIGRGGMGVVYEAMQQSLGRHVALKVLSSPGLLNPVHLERFRLEARSAGRLHHSHIVPVFGVGEHDGLHYYAMQFIVGQSLDQVIDALRLVRGPAEGVPELAKAADPTGTLASGLMQGFPRAGVADGTELMQASHAAQSRPDEASWPNTPSDQAAARSAIKNEFSSGSTGKPFYHSVARVGLQVAEALAYAHAEGVLHRDIKPANLLLDDKGNIWVTDFGLAKAEASDGLTAAGDFVGTLRYMAPERLDGLSDRSSDIYSLGATLYELLTLRPFFETSSRAKLIDSIRHEQPLAPARIDPAVPRDLETIVLKALAKEPSHRYQSAQAMADDLQNWLAGKPIVARPVGLLGRGMRWAKREPVIAGLAATMALLLIVGISISSWFAVAAAKNAREARQYASVMLKEREKADMRAEAERRAKEDKQLALAQSNYNEYVAEMRLVDRSLAIGDFVTARRALKETPPTCRGVEWDLAAAELAQELVTFRGHAGAILSAAFSPDGQQIVSSSVDGTIKQWDAETGAEVRTLKGHRHAVFSVDFSSDGRRIVSGGGDNLIKLWDAGTGQELRTFEGHARHVVSVAFSPDSRRIVSGGYDNLIKLWDVESGKEIETLKGHSGGVMCVAFSPDGQRIVSGSEDKTLMSWDLDIGKSAGKVLGKTDFFSIDSAKFSPDGRRIVAGCSALRMWDTESGREVYVRQGQFVNAVAICPDGLLIASGNGDSTIAVWELETGRVLYTLKGHDGPVKSIAFSPDGRRIVSGSDDNTLKLWDAKANRVVRELQARGKSVNSVAFSPDGQRIVSGSNDKTIRLWDAKTGQQLRTLKGHTSWVKSVAFSPDGGRVVSGSADNTTKVWDAVTGEELRTLKGHLGAVMSVALSHDGRRLASGAFDNSFIVWDAETGQKRYRVNGQTSGVWSVAISPDGRTIVSANGDTAKLWDAGTGRELQLFAGHTKTVLSVAFSPDGQRIVTGSGDKTLKVWAVESAREIRTLQGHAGPVHYVALSSDGCRILSASNDRTIKLWDADTGQELRTLQGFGQPVHCVAMSPDGHRIVASYGDGTIKLWDAELLDEVSRYARVLVEETLDRQRDSNRPQNIFEHKSNWPAALKQAVLDRL